MQRRVFRVVLEKREIFVGKTLHVCGQRGIKRKKCRVLEMPHAGRNSEFFALSRVMVGARFSRKPIQFSGFGVPLDLFVELPLLKLLEPRPELGELLAAKLGNGLLYVFYSGHNIIIA